MVRNLSAEEFLQMGLASVQFCLVPHVKTNCRCFQAHFGADPSGEDKWHQMRS
jgi:hypothetical protein